MPFTETVRIALRAILTNKMRSALTMLGIIIGVASVIMLAAIGNGSSLQIRQNIESLGANLLQISPTAAREGGVSLGAGSRPSLTMADVQAIAQQDTAVAAVVPVLSISGQVVWGPNNYETSIQGTTWNYGQVRPTPVAEGRSFTPQEQAQSATVAVLGATVLQNLFPPGFNPIGQTIEINRVPFTVIGVLQTEGATGFVNQDDRIIIPITTMENDLDSVPFVNQILASAKSAADMNLAQAEITATLRADHHLAPSQADDFQIFNQATLLSSLSSVSATLTALLTGVAAISLLVGGIGIMNIMLVSVTERTREIGIRKAIGATRGMILTQFVIEAVTVSALGGLLGAIVGVGGSGILGRLMHTPAPVSGTSVAVAFLFALLVGVVFGVYPARKAALLKPIDALRFE
ncbi:MAG: ABC transporter permease [Firmicutes bacterium]|nr:ABC transporter permease [Alicyclobacillaceae bacterium]MCL6497044.1 ABC transporter permease [Bacillota bacterium]